MTAANDTKPVVKVAEFLVAAEVTINDPDVIERVTGPKGDEWRGDLYDLHTEEDVINHLAYNCLANGCENATMLDGWADLPAEAVEMRRVIAPYEYDAFAVGDASNSRLSEPTP